MSKIKLTGSNSGYVEISSAADAGNLTLQLPTAGTALLSNAGNVFTGITTTGQLDINGSIDVSSTSVFNNDLTLKGGSYDVLWDSSDNALEFGTNAKATFGDAMQIYHDGSNSLIQDSGTGHVQIRSGTFTVGNAGLTKTSAIFNSGSGQQLNFNNNQKFITTNTGVVVTGICTASSFSGDGSNLTNLSAGAASYNAVINGEMLVSQRGSDFTNVSSSDYHLDRWYLYYQNSSAVFRIRHSADSPDGFHQSYRVNVTTADTSIASNEEVKLFHKIEGQNLGAFAKGTSGAKKFTLSFYVKCNKTGTYVVELYDRDNGRDVSGSYTVSNTNWNRYTIDFPADTTGEFGFDNGSSLEISFWLVAGSAVQTGSLNTTWRSSQDGGSAVGQVNFTDSTSNEWMLTGVQLEPTTTGTASDFKHEGVAETLAKCQRYYYLHHNTSKTGTSGNYRHVCIGFVSGNTEVTGHIFFPVTMRANPSIDHNYGVVGGIGYWRLGGGSLGGDKYVDGAWTLASPTTRSTRIYATPRTGLNQSLAGYIDGRNSASYMAFNAEL